MGGRGPPRGGRPSVAAPWAGAAMPRPPRAADEGGRASRAGARARARAARPTGGGGWRRRHGVRAAPRRRRGDPGGAWGRGSVCGGADRRPMAGEGVARRPRRRAARPRSGARRGPARPTATRAPLSAGLWRADMAVGASAVRLSRAPVGADGHTRESNSGSQSPHVARHRHGGGGRRGEIDKRHLLSSWHPLGVRYSTVPCGTALCRSLHIRKKGVKRVAHF